MRSLFLLLVLLVACTPSRTVYLSDDEPSEVTFATLDAVAFWNDEIGWEALQVRMVSNARLGYAHPGAIVVRSVRVVDGPDTYHTAETDFYVGANVELERSAFQVGPGYLQHEGQGVDLVAHELGHALGLIEHEGDALKGTGGRNLMRANGYGKEGRDLTPEQTRRVRALLGGVTMLAP